MVIDSSVLIAVILGEPEARRIAVTMASAKDRLVSAATVVEATIVLEGREGDGAGLDLELLLRRLDVTIVSVDEAQVSAAVRAWRRFGKGRHPAALNYGDCFSYALAAIRDMPLLFKGDDLSQTDIAAVSY